MRVFFKFEPTPEQMARQFGADVQGARRAGFINVVTMIEAIATKKAPVKTSNLANSHTSDVNAEATRGFVRFTAPYAKYVHGGTGLYGPHKTKIVSDTEIIIRPKNAKALFWPGASHPVMAVKTTKSFYWAGAKYPVKSIKGMKPQPFLREAAEEADLQRLFSDGVNNYLAGRGKRS